MQNIIEWFFTFSVTYTRRKWKWRHWAMPAHDGTCYVQEIASFFEENLTPEYNVLADLPRFQPYVFPPRIAATDERPDIVMWNNQTKEVWIVELTVCFDTNCNEAHARKTERYADLMEKIATSPLAGNLVTLEIGSRGQCSAHTGRQWLTPTTTPPHPTSTLRYPTTTHSISIYRSTAVCPAMRGLL